jgi:hypothetical protein
VAVEGLTRAKADASVVRPAFPSLGGKVTEREHEHDPGAEEQVEDLDVPESESEDVKGGAFDAFNTGLKLDGIKGELKIQPGGLQPGGLNFHK